MNTDVFDQYPLNQPGVRIGILGIGQDGTPGVIGIANGGSGINIGVQAIVTDERV